MPPEFPEILDHSYGDFLMPPLVVAHPLSAGGVRGEQGRFLWRDARTHIHQQIVGHAHAFDDGVQVIPPLGREEDIIGQGTRLHAQHHGLDHPRSQHEGHNDHAQRTALWYRNPHFVGYTLSSSDGVIDADVLLEVSICLKYAFRDPCQFSKMVYQLPEELIETLENIRAVPTDLHAL